MQVPNDPSLLTATQKVLVKTRRAFNDFSIKFEAQRLAFSFNKLKHEEIIGRIEKNNEKLGRFLELSDDIAILQGTRQKPVARCAPKNLLQYWKHAEHLYTLFDRAWGCKCKSLHYANLWLQHRTSPIFQFSLLVVFAPSGATPASAPWQRQGLKIETLKELEGHSSSAALATTAPPIPNCRDAQPKRNWAKIRYVAGIIN